MGHHEKIMVCASLVYMSMTLGRGLNVTHEHKSLLLLLSLFGIKTRVATHG